MASLSDYNAGTLHGTWINADQPPEAIQAEINQMLEHSPNPPAEEWAIHDHEGFAGCRLSEFEALNTVSAIAAAISEHGPAVTSWLNYQGESSQQVLDGFEQVFRGEWPSLAAYADDLITEADPDITVSPQWLEPYVRVDTEALARDLDMELHTDRSPQGVYIFDPNAYDPRGGDQ